MATQQDEFGKGAEPVRGEKHRQGWSDPTLLPRKSRRSLQPCIAPMRDEFRPRTGEERESTNFGSRMTSVKKVIISVSTSVCTESVTQRAFYQRILNGFETAKPESSGVRTTEMGGSDPTLDGFQPPKRRWGRSRPVTTER
jgi:hypothetical protein